MIHALDGCGDFFEVPFDIVPDQLHNIVCPLQYLMGKDMCTPQDSHSSLPVGSLGASDKAFSPSLERYTCTQMLNIPLHHHRVQTVVKFQLLTINCYFSETIFIQLTF